MRRPSARSGCVARWAVLALALALFAGGCQGRRDPTPAAALGDPSLQGARAALEAYLQARRSLDWARVYELLSARARKAYRLEDLKAFFESYVAYGYREVGEPREEDPGWVRFPVRGVRWELEGAPPLEGREWWVTLRYEEGRWGVGLADPLVERAREAARRGDVATLGQVADTMLAIDPWSYRAHVQKALALAFGGQREAAAVELDQAYRVVPEELRGEVLIQFGNLFRALGQPPLAARAYRDALASVDRYPDFYSASFAAAVRLSLAQVQILTGDLEGAAREAAVALVLDPGDVMGNLLAVDLAALTEQVGPVAPAAP